MQTPQALSRTRDLIDKDLRATVLRLDQNLRVPSTYHMGWSDEHGNPLQANAGKGVRSTLCVLGAEAIYGRHASSGDAAISGAIAVELIHNFSLVHDDIMDGDHMRRHRRTVWDVFGVGDAILVGDALHALAFEALLADPAQPADTRRVAAAGRLAIATSAMIAGQAQDVALDRSAHASLDDCLAMEANKTGALLSQSVAIGATLAGADLSQVETLESYGIYLGKAFQAVDDVLGIWGDPNVTGKAAGNDLREHKKSVPVVLALQAGGEVSQAVSDAFSKDLNEQEVAELADFLQRSGLREQTEQLAAKALDNALASLENAELAETAVGELGELARFVVKRDS